MHHTTATEKAYLDQVESGHITSTAWRILDLIEGNQTMNTAELAKKIGIAEGTVTARIDFLREHGFVQPIGEQMEGRRTVTLWAFVADRADREHIGREYRREKYLRKLKALKGEKYAEFRSQRFGSVLSEELEALAEPVSV